MTDDRVLFEVDAANRIATVTLNNPRQRNSYDAAMRGEIARYLDIVAEDEAYRRSPRFETDRAYWTEHLAGLGDPVSLAGRAAPADAHPLLVGAELPPHTEQALRDAAARRGSSLAPLVVAAFGTYLARMTGSPEVLLSLPVSGRHSAVLRRSGGMVANVVPLRVPVAGCTLDEVVTAVKGELLSALRRQRYRQEDIFRDMGIARDEASSFGPAVRGSERVRRRGCPVVWGPDVERASVASRAAVRPDAPCGPDAEGSPCRPPLRSPRRSPPGVRPRGWRWR